MKIAILSMQEIINSGSFLQAYALKKSLEKFDANIIWKDYKKIYINNFESKKKFYGFYLIKIIEKSFKNIFSYEYKKRKLASKKSIQFYNKYGYWLKEYGIVPSSENDYDKVIIGSDEVFNIVQFIEFKKPIEIPWELYGEGYNNKKIASYAASAGQTTFEKLQKYNLTEKSKKLLSRFSSLSARDENTQKMLLELGLKSDIHIDPVLLHDFSEIDLVKPQEKNYILVYAYDFRISHEESMEIIKYAKKHNKKILSVNFQQYFSDYMKVVSPLEMLSYFKYADCVITDTFHGAIISMKYNVNFVTLVRSSNINKLGYLLHSFDLENRIAKETKQIGLILDKKIDYNDFNIKLKNERAKSFQYLKEFVQDE